ncbi:MAG TPA: hypothetical protein VL126_14855, partial [Bacteroidota bacterium]|nr:hypothetical protein [Bacteroidota bacterium]
VDGKTEQAKGRCLNLLKSSPDVPGPILLAGEVCFYSRDFASAQNYFEKELALTGAESNSYNELAYIYAKQHRDRDADKMLDLNIQETLQWLGRGDEGPESRMSLAISYKLKGNDREAYKWLHESVKAGWTGYRLAALNPLFDSFRKDAEFNRTISSVKAGMAEMIKRAEELDKD